MENKKCYVLMLAKKFPAYHLKSGQPTDFKYKIRKAINDFKTLGAVYSFLTAKETELSLSGDYAPKIHTIRTNIHLWIKRAEKINNGKAYLSVREWLDKPYRSKQRELFRFYKISIELIKLTTIAYLLETHNFGIPQNDGLNFDDFMQWFNPNFKDKKHNTNECYAIIHFTDFRYIKN